MARTKRKAKGDSNGRPSPAPPYPALRSTWARYRVFAYKPSNDMLRCRTHAAAFV